MGGGVSPINSSTGVICLGALGVISTISTPSWATPLMLLEDNASFANPSLKLLASPDALSIRLLAFSPTCVVILELSAETRSTASLPILLIKSLPFDKFLVISFTAPAGRVSTPSLFATNFKKVSLPSASVQPNFVPNSSSNSLKEPFLPKPALYNFPPYLPITSLNAFSLKPDPIFLKSSISFSCFACIFNDCCSASACCLRPRNPATLLLI